MKCDYCGRRMWPWQRQWRGPLYGHPWVHQRCLEERRRTFFERFGEDAWDAAWDRLIARVEESADEP